MSIPIEMPQLSADAESATLATWLVAVGDAVEKGEVIAELETDKSTVELEAPASGTLATVLVEAGTEEIAPGTVLGTIDSSSEESSEEASSGSASDAEPSSESSPETVAAPAVEPSRPPVSASDPAPASTPAVGKPALQAPTSEAHPRSPTPLARRAAERSGVEIESLVGSGPGGRVVESDVLIAAGGVEAPSQGLAAGPAAVEVDPEAIVEGDFERVRLSAMRKTIARRLTESKQQVPHFYLRMRCPMDAVVAVRARLNAGLAEEGSSSRISVNDFIVRAAALALRDVPAANVQFGGDELRVFDRVDISVAVATEGGLVTPIVRDADRKSLTRLSDEIAGLAEKARAGTLAPGEYQGGTLTISNLGMYGIETVYPILNPPQACIIGVGAAEEQPVVRDGEICIGRIAALTLAADHRAVDGAVGAQLLAALRSRLEDPLGMML